jgi:hypothetical protein
LGEQEIAISPGQRSNRKLGCELTSSVAVEI